MLSPPAAALLEQEGLLVREKWLAALCWTTIGFCALQILLFGFGPDQAASALAGRVLLEGGTPYRDVPSSGAPGIFFVHAASQLLLGDSPLALRLVEVLGLGVLIVCLRSLGATLFGGAGVGLMAGALAALVHAQLDFASTGQAETFAGVFTVAALAVTCWSTRRAALQAACLGALAGAVLVLEPLLSGCVVVCAAHLARRVEAIRRQGAAVVPCLVLVACFLLPALSATAWFWARGALPELWAEATLAAEQAQATRGARSLLELVYSAAAELFVGFSALLAIGTILALALRRPAAREREGFFLIFGVIAVQLVGVAARGTFAPDHFGAALPLLALIAGLGWFKLFRQLDPGGRAGKAAFTGKAAFMSTAAFVGCLLLAGAMRDAGRDVPGSFWQRSALRTGYLLRLGPSSREELERRLAPPVPQLPPAAP